jgi:hypothetical protein
MIIWIASYPKSGNTWVRAFITSLLFKKEKGTSFKDLMHINIYPRRSLLKNYTNNFHDFEELSKYWLITQKDINKDNKVRFLKTHHATCKIKGNNFTDTENTLGRIYVVRDPRNVITSFKHHFSLESIEDAFKVISNKSQLIGNQETNKQITVRTDKQVCTFISSWAHHYNSWKINWGNNLLIKYENLIKEPEKEFGKIKLYLEGMMKSKIDEKKFKQAINENSFEKLKNLEKKKGFGESAYDYSTKKELSFFNLGPNNNWEKLLDSKITKKIEEEFSKEMLELGYL